MTDENSNSKINSPMPQEVSSDPQKGGSLETPPVSDEAADYVQKANDAAERLEKANIELKQLLRQQEKHKFENTIGGTAAAGRQKLTVEQQKNENAKKQLEGTGFESMFDETT